MARYNGNNFAVVTGRICDGITLDHCLYGETFYSSRIEVPRLSGTVDILPVTLPGRLLQDAPVDEGRITLEGQLRSYNRHMDGGGRLIITLFARSIALAPEDALPVNDICLIGNLCKAPVYRTTPFMREIADLLLAVNRSYNKSDYLPCIAWGVNARFASGLSVGAQLLIRGRLQSRVYQKCFEDGTMQERTAYEVSCSFIEQI